MWTNIDDTARESNILRDLADFDINAPINVTVCFDTDCDVTSNILIKTENDTDSNIAENNDVVEHFASVRDLKSKEEIKKEPFESHRDIKAENGHILQEITTHQAEEIQNKLSNNDDFRKRKQQQLQIYKNKKAAKMTEQIKTDDRTEKRDENEAQEKVNALTTENPLLVYNQTPESAPLPQPHLGTVLPNPSVMPPQPDVHVQAKYKANCQTMLLDLADHMRQVMDAYWSQKQNKISKENFILLKDRYFTLSYDTVDKMILPKEENKEFIHLFLKETHRRACEKSYYKCTYQDYAILLGELITWVRKRAIFMKQKFNNTIQPTKIDENAKIQQERNQRQLRNNKNKIDNLNKSAEVNSVCIFSSGSPGNEISINIDPNINRYIMSAIVNETNKDVRNIQPPPVSIASQNQSQNPCNSVITARTNNKKMTINAKQQPALSPSANMLVTEYQPPRSPEPNRNQSSLIELLTSIDIPTQHIHPKLPQEMQSVQSHHELHQSLYHSANVPVQFGQSPSLPPKYGQITNQQIQHGHSQSMQEQYRQPEGAILLHEQLLNNQLQVQSQYGKQQNMQQQHKHSVHAVPQYSQSQNRPQQSPHSLHQYVHSQPILPHYEQAQQQRSQTHLPNYNQHHNILGQPQAQLNHMFPHGGHIRPVPPPYPHYVLQQHTQPRNSPIQVGLPKPVHPYYEQPQHALPQKQQSKHISSQAGLTKPVHPYYEQPQHALPQNQQSKHTSSQAGQLQQQANHLKELLDKPQRPIEWPHEFTAIYSQPNMQQQIQKNTPRSASTDSGFISPLNFNVFADQTVFIVPYFY